jgi:signal transduction histidine kinase
VSIETGSRPGQGGPRGWVRVTDTGPGIAAAHLPHLFDRFYRVDQARSQNHDGSGLGLAIVQWVAQAHGGEAIVQSTPGQGATFEVRLPLSQPARTGTAYANASTALSPLTVPGD